MYMHIYICESIHIQVYSFVQVPYPLVNIFGDLINQLRRVPLLIDTDVLVVRFSCCVGYNVRRATSAKPTPIWLGATVGKRVSVGFRLHDC